MLQPRLNLKQWLGGFNLGIMVYVAMVLCSLLVFQNCSEPIEFSEEDQATLSDELPFAYDLKLDTFAYMSCGNLFSTSFDNRAMFNFRMGAYEPTSGIKLSEEYMDRTANYTPEARAEALFRSPTNTGAIVQMGIRNIRQNLQEHFQQERGTTTFGADIDNFLLGAPLSAPGIGQALSKLEEEQRINYFKGTPGLEGRLIEASLRQYEYDALRVATRGFFNNLGLTVTYTVEENSLSFFARGPDLNNITRRVYGYKYEPTFNGPKKKFGSASEVGYTGTYADTGNVVQDRTVVELREVNLDTNESSVWSCPPDLRLVVINPEDMAPGGPRPCLRNADTATVDDPSSLNARDRKRLEVIRRVLRVEDYYVNLAQNCVIPKDSRNSCYPNEAEDNITVTINYGTGAGSANCQDDPSAGTYSCANYVSICTRDPLPL